MASTRREFVAAAAATAIVPAAACAAPGSTVTPEMFGAKGDGRTNDTHAFAAMSAHVNARDGGTIVLRPVTYIVGEQKASPGRKRRSFMPVDIIHLTRCRAPIAIQGNGATLRAAPGLRFGRFDPKSGNPLPDPPRRDSENVAVPYGGMIHIDHCSGKISISDLELDGNLQRMRIGGKSAKNSFQNRAFGIWLAQNRGAESLSRINSHHHASDGLVLMPSIDRSGSTTVTDSVFSYNGRQGCSITGGRNFLFQRCKFQHTGKAGLHHAPGDGVNIEAEGVPIRNALFEDCEFSDNTAFAMGAGRPNDTAEISFVRCKFIGTTNWAAGPDRPLMRFRNCLFLGTIGHVYGDPDPKRAVQFLDCTFTDDPRLSPTGQVFLGRGGSRSVALIRDRQNVLFSRCKFRLVGDGTLPVSEAAIYDSCEMSQRSPAPSKPRGTYVGTTSIRGNANLEGAIIRGKVTLNGRVLPRTG